MRYAQHVSGFPFSRDQKLVQIVDAALADASRRSGQWLACRPGCTQCCIGVFAISQLDALRLRRGLKKLESTAPERAHAVRERAQEAVRRMSPTYPGDLQTGSEKEIAPCEMVPDPDDLE